MKKNMKCEHCNENEATFYYKSNVNGKVTEKHLCRECAEKMGYWDDMTVSTSLFDLFAPMRMPVLSGGFFGEDLFDSAFDRMLRMFPAPRFALARADEEDAAQETTDKAPQLSDEEEADLKRQRELNALRSELKSCVEREDYERAIVLRDKIRKLEA